MDEQQIEQRRAQLGPARNTAEQLCFEAIEDAIMDVIAAQRSQDTTLIATATARAEAYLEAIGIYRQCTGKGHPIASGAPQRTSVQLNAPTTALIAAIRTTIPAIRTNPAGAEAVLINALADATGLIN